MLSNKYRKEPSPHPAPCPDLSGWMAESEARLGTKGSAGLRWVPADPAKQRHRRPGLDGGRGLGRKGHGRPCYCWQEVAPFFPDGETEAQGGFFFFGNLPKVTHSESAFQGERGSSHSKKHGLPHLESKRQKRSRTARGGHHPL